MSRYIDADALECDTEWSEYHDGFISYSQLEIDTAPSIDIVKCGDCKYDHQCNHSVQRITSKPDYMSIIYVPIGWCERGERRDI